MAKSRRRQDSAASSSSSRSQTASATLDRIDGSTPTDGDGRRDRIAQRAYELYLARGGTHGADWDDWLAAEREVLGVNE